MTLSPLEQVREALEAAERGGAIYRFDRLQGYVPYPWQRMLHRKLDVRGNPAKQSMLMGGNQIGKTLFGASDVAIHMTGRYPKWWEGPRFDRPIKVLGGGVSTTSTRDVVQLKLLGGDPENEEVFGTGLIPLECLLDKKGKPMTDRWVGNPGGVQKFYVRHISGGLSQCDLKSYEQGPGPWMGVQADLVWLDEEPPRPIYSQALRATIATGGYIILTMTPENGATDIVQEFRVNLKAGQLYVQVGWNDAPHLTEPVKAQLLLAYPIHERDMRSKGIPMLGQGLVFPFPWSQVSCPSFPIPASWPRIAGMDFGSGGDAHATACGWVAFDPNGKSAVGYAAYKSHASAAVHAAAIRARGPYPIAWPHDGNRADGYTQNTQGISKSLADIYRAPPLSLPLLRDHFHNPISKDNAIETGITALSLALEFGLFKWFDNLLDVKQEYEMYHRKDGKIVKKEDDLMSCFRYAFQSKNYAQGAEPREYSDQAVAGTYDYDPFNHEAA